MSVLTALLLGALVLLLTGIAALASRQGGTWCKAVYGITLAVSIVILALAAIHLADGAPVEQITLPLGIPWIGLHLRLDALSAFFLLILGLGGALASLFALGYGRDEPAPRRVLPFVPAFLAAMQLVLLADDAFAFLLAFESMSLLSMALVLVHHREALNQRAAYIYLLMAGLGTMALLLAFGLLAGPTGAYAFDAIRARTLAPWLQGLVFVLVLLGTGSKAGLVPLHIWLPLAHPAAPSHVSALMSGVMTKVAIYALLRILLDLAGPPAWWAGGVLMLVGALTAVMGLLYAVLETDLKRLLAYSTVENIGIIVTAIGLAAAFRAGGLEAAAALALTAGLLHALNHTVFKSLLFMGAGAVLHGIGTGDMERLGGLIRRMPQTALAMLVGAVAISALPPLNGFVSEWLLFQAVLQSPALPSWLLKVLAAAVGALLALAAALAAACFVRAYGITFLGRPRSTDAALAHEVDPWSRLGLLVPAGLCLLLGVFPGPVIDLLGGCVAFLNGGTSLPLRGGQGWLSLQPVPASASSYNGLVLLLFLIVSGSLVTLAVHRFASSALRRAPVWDCGTPDPSPTTQYTARSFSQPLRRVFGTALFAAREAVDMPAPGDTRAAGLTVQVHDLVLERLYQPLGRLVMLTAERLNRLQFLTVRRYLSFMFAALVGLLVVTAVWR